MLRSSGINMFRITPKMLKNSWKKRKEFSKNLKNKSFLKSAKIIDFKFPAL